MSEAQNPVDEQPKAAGHKPRPPDRTGKKVPYRKPPRTAQEAMLDTPGTEDPKIHAAIKDYLRQTIAELGGWASLTAAQRAMLLCQRIHLLVVLTAESQIVASGSLMNSSGKSVHRLLGVLEKFSGLFRQGQVALGLNKARIMPPKKDLLSDVLGEYARKKKKDDSKLKVVES